MIWKLRNDRVIDAIHGQKWDANTRKGVMCPRPGIVVVRCLKRKRRDGAATDTNLSSIQSFEGLALECHIFVPCIDPHLLVLGDAAPRPLGSPGLAKTQEILQGSPSVSSAI